MGLRIQSRPGTLMMKVKSFLSFGLRRVRSVAVASRKASVNVPSAKAETTSLSRRVFTILLASSIVRWPAEWAATLQASTLPHVKPIYEMVSKKREQVFPPELFADHIEILEQMYSKRTEEEQEGRQSSTRHSTVDLSELVLVTSANSCDSVKRRRQSKEHNFELGEDSRLRRALRKSGKLHVIARIDADRLWAIRVMLSARYLVGHTTHTSALICCHIHA